MGMKPATSGVAACEPGDCKALPRILEGKSINIQPGVLLTGDLGVYLFIA